MVKDQLSLEELEVAHECQSNAHSITKLAANHLHFAV